jgi:hypothetical protein
MCSNALERAVLSPFNRSTDPKMQLRRTNLEQLCRNRPAQILGRVSKPLRSIARRTISGSLWLPVQLGLGICALCQPQEVSRVGSRDLQDGVFEDFPGAILGVTRAGCAAGHIAAQTQGHHRSVLSCYPEPRRVAESIFQSAIPSSVAPSRIGPSSVANPRHNSHCLAPSDGCAPTRQGLAARECAGCGTSTRFHLAPNAVFFAGSVRPGRAVIPILHSVYVLGTGATIGCFWLTGLVSISDKWRTVFQVAGGILGLISFGVLIGWIMSMLGLEMEL